MKYSETIRDYEQKIGPVPSGVLKFAPITRHCDALQRDLAKAVQTGEPIQDWSPYAGLSPKSPAERG